VSLGWFPDSIRLAVAVSTRQKAHGIMVFRTDDPHGRPQGLFGSKGYTLAPENPSISPNGKRVAVEMWRMDSPENRQLLGVAVLPTDSGITIVKEKADLGKVPIVIRGEAHEPKWSPDGTRLLYWMYGKNGRDLWVAGVDGSRAVNLTHGVGDNSEAAWSPARR
jgi:hypothetical protein